MQRLFLVLLVALLCVTTSGALELVVPDQCASETSKSPASDGACPPTCLRCHCARPFDVVMPPLFSDVLFEPAEWLEPARPVPSPTPHDVLHVPRPAAA